MMELSTMMAGIVLAAMSVLSTLAIEMQMEDNEIINSKTNMTMASLIQLKMEANTGCCLGFYSVEKFTWKGFNSLFHLTERTPCDQSLDERQVALQFCTPNKKVVFYLQDEFSKVKPHKNIQWQTSTATGTKSEPLVCCMSMVSWKVANVASKLKLTITGKMSREKNTTCPKHDSGRQNSYEESFNFCDYWDLWFTGNSPTERTFVEEWNQN